MHLPSEGLKRTHGTMPSVAADATVARVGGADRRASSLLSGPRGSVGWGVLSRFCTLLPLLSLHYQGPGVVLGVLCIPCRWGPGAREFPTKPPPPRAA